MGSSTKTRLPH